MANDVKALDQDELSPGEGAATAVSGGAPEEPARETGSHDETILMPGPSIGPLILGLGMTVLVLGLVWVPLFAVGGVLSVVGVWITSGRSKAQLEVDHHMEEETRRVLPGVDLPKLGMWVFLASEVMFFAALISTFIAFRRQPEFDAIVTEHGVVNHHEVLNLPLVTFNTFLLLASSFAAASALAALHKDRQGAFRRMLIATLVLGAVFVGIQGYEWYELLHQGIGPDVLFGTAFFTTTGFHGLHVTLGLVALLFILARAFRGAYTSANPLGIELFGLYWHFVDVVWIVLFTLIYLVK